MASDPMEYSGIVAHTKNPTPASFSVDWARAAALGAHQVLLTANGVGWKRAAQAVDATRDFRPEAVVSTGFCGALEQDLAIGDVVVGSAVQRAGHPGFPCRPVVSLTARRTGAVCSLDHVARTADEKKRLRSSGASVVEMEAAGVAERVLALGLPFHCVKSITDLAGETLENDFNSALRSDGHFDTMLILRRSLRHPATRLPELFRLRKRCVRAARALGEFFADCRF